MKPERTKHDRRPESCRGKWRRPAIVLVVALAAMAAVTPGGAISCPSGGAKVEVCVNNPATTTSPSITVSGSYIPGEATCLGPNPPIVGTYSYTSTYPPGQTCTTLPSSNGIFSGMFRHRINVSSTTQDQYQQGVVMYSTGTRSRVEWTFFPKVMTVSQAGSAGSGSCPFNFVTSNCDIRKAIDEANADNGNSDPILIRFTTSPGVLAPGNLTITRTNLTIDGTDSNGNPWIVGDANAAAAGSQDPFPTVLHMAQASGIRISADNVTLQGLEIKHDLSFGGNPLSHLVRHLSGSFTGTVLKSVRLDHATTDDCVSGTCTEIFDLVNIPNRAASSGTPDVTLINVEARSAIDQGIQLGTNTFADIQRSWIRNNYKGNISAAGPNRVEIERSVIERAGLRATDDRLVQSNAAGISISSAGTLETNGNIVRNNAYFGVSASGLTDIRPMEDSVCGNGAHGFYTSSAGGTPSVTGFGGLGYTYNQGNGANVVQDDFSAVSLNNDSVLTSNALCGLWNNWSGDPVVATNNQWSGSAPYPDTCVGSAPGDVTVDPVQNHRGAGMTVDSVFPSNVILKGQTLRVQGTIFNAIDGNPPASAACTTGVNGSGGSSGGQANSCCNKTTRSNKCSELHEPGGFANGNCVELRNGTGGWTQSVPVRSVSPAMLEVEIPNTFTCLGGSAEKVSVAKSITAGGTIRQETDYCTNDGAL